MTQPLLSSPILVGTCRERGVYTDVIARAYRDAFGIDLQQLVHVDMLASFKSYPHEWGLRAPDASIDHRRVLNLKVFFKRKGRELAASRSAVDYAPGDLVTQELPSGLPHIVIVSDARSQDGARPLVIHNIGQGTKVEDTLFDYPITAIIASVPLQLRKADFAYGVTLFKESALPDLIQAPETSAFARALAWLSIFQMAAPV